MHESRHADKLRKKFCEIFKTTFNEYDIMYVQIWNEYAPISNAVPILRPFFKKNKNPFEATLRQPPKMVFFINTSTDNARIAWLDGTRSKVFEVWDLLPREMKEGHRVVLEDTGYVASV